MLYFSQVIEPSLDGGETINTIPIKVSVQALFSKYSVNPSNGINFGPLVYGSRKKQTLIVENRGCFEMRFTIRICKNAPVPAQRRGYGYCKNILYIVKKIMNYKKNNKTYTF